MAAIREGEVAGFDYRRDEPFNYSCNRCRRCCYGKRIPLNPYDLIRLADVLALTTGELVARFTEDGVLLKVRSDIDGEPCVFLGDQGCTVHAGRPGACRIYPLGRSASLDGDERFALVQPHPQTEGVYDTNGTIGAFVAGQGLEPYFDASARYLRLFAMLARAGEVGDGEPNDGDDTHPLDVDAVVSKYCSARNLPPPSDPTAKMLLHIEAIESLLADG